LCREAIRSTRRGKRYVSDERSGSSIEQTCSAAEIACRPERRAFRSKRRAFARNYVSCRVAETTGTVRWSHRTRVRTWTCPPGEPTVQHRRDAHAAWWRRASRWAGVTDLAVEPIAPAGEATAQPSERIATQHCRIQSPYARM